VCGVDAAILVHLGEIDERKLYLDWRFSSTAGSLGASTRGVMRILFRRCASHRASRVGPTSRVRGAAFRATAAR
jgi:hypothetical protein